VGKEHSVNKSLRASADELSPRLAAVVESLPLRSDLRVLEIGCGTGAVARAIARQLGDGGHILAMDRSEKAVQLTIQLSQDEIASGRLSVRQSSVEDFTLDHDEAPFDLVFAVRVGVLDGRHPNERLLALGRIAAAMTSSGRLFIDGGNPLREIQIEKGTT